MARIESFIAASSKVAIRQPKQANAVWYTTKKDIVVNLETATEVDCPMGRMTGRGQNRVPARVLRVVESGIEVFFPRPIVRSRLVVEAGDVDPAAYNVTYSQFQYDIPEWSEYPNPSGWLRSVAVRDTLSCWIIRKGDVSISRIGEMLDAGVRVKIRDYAAHETRELVEDMIRSLFEQAQEAMESVQSREAAAEAYLNTAEEEGITEEVARRNYEVRIKNIARDINDLSGSLETVAKTLGLNGAMRFVNLNRLRTITRETTKRMNKRVAAYRQGVAALAAVGTLEATAMANAAATGEDVLPNAMADMLREAGNDAAADAIDHTFRLTDDAE